MSNHNFHFLHVLNDNVLLIFSGVFGWILTFLGVNLTSINMVFTGDGWQALDWILSHFAVLLSCTVSLATLYKIRKELKKN